MTRSPTEATPVVHLLWSGGWDSTFRLLDLLWSYRCNVQPYYVIDRTRKSLGVELKTLHSIRRACLARPKPLLGVCAPPIFIEAAHIAPDQAISSGWTRLSARHHLGDQYDWLGRLATQLGLSNLEIGIHAQNNAFWFLEKYFERRVARPTATYVLRSDVDSDLRTVFGRFHFPLLKLSKTDMRRIAAEQGFLDVLEMSWFCHAPLRGGRPCGTCRPCNDAFNEGMSYRIGWRGMLRHYTIKPAYDLIPEWVKRPLRPAVRWIRRRGSGVPQGKQSARSD